MNGPTPSENTSKLSWPEFSIEETPFQRNIATEKEILKPGLEVKMEEMATFLYVILV